VRGSPFGSTVWEGRTAERLGLQKTLRWPGRPSKRGPWVATAENAKNAEGFIRHEQLRATRFQGRRKQ